VARTFYQYQPLTGPVWRAPVAPSLAWLPRGQWQPLLALPPNRLGDVTEPFVLAVAVASGLQWVPAGNVFVRGLAPNRLTDSIVAPFVDAMQVARNLQWLGSRNTVVQPAERRFVDWTVLPPFQPPASYDPAGLQWSSVLAEPVLLPRIVQPWSLLDPFPRPPVSYDPAGMQWLYTQPSIVQQLARASWDWTVVVAGIYDPAGLDWLTQFALSRTGASSLRGDLVEPFTNVLYDPAGLQWWPSGWMRYPLIQERGVQTWSLLDPFPLPPVSYDPAGLQWLTLLPTPVLLLRDIQTWSLLDPNPLPTVPFDPSGLQWIPAVPVTASVLLAGVMGSVVLDPLPLPGVPSGPETKGVGGRKRRKPSSKTLAPPEAPVERGPEFSSTPFYFPPVTPKPVIPVAPKAPSVTPAEPSPTPVEVRALPALDTSVPALRATPPMDTPPVTPLLPADEDDDLEAIVIALWLEGLL
jgi:hypothetical protein